MVEQKVAVQRMARPEASKKLENFTVTSFSRDKFLHSA